MITHEFMRACRPSYMRQERCDGLVEHHWFFKRHPRLTIVQRVAGERVTNTYCVDGIDCVSFDAAVARLNEVVDG